MVKKAALPAGVATALALLPDAAAKKVLIILGLTITVPTTTAGFVSVVLASRAQNLAALDQATYGKGLDPSFLSGGPMDIGEKLDKAVHRRRAVVAELEQDAVAPAATPRVDVEVVRKLLAEDRVIHARLKPEKMRPDVNADVRLSQQLGEIDALHERLSGFLAVSERAPAR